MPRCSHFDVMDDSKRLWVSNGLIGVEFRREHDRDAWQLCAVSDGKRDAIFGLSRGSDDVWWEMEWRDRDAFRATLTSQSPGRFSHEVTQSPEGDQLTVTLRWKELSLRLARYGSLEVAAAVDSSPDTDTVDVEVRLCLAKDEPLTRWSWHVWNRSMRYTLWQVVFPRAGNVHRVDGDRENEHLTLPADWGWYVPRPAHRQMNWTATYPSHRCCMQFMAFHSGENGLYLGWHDPTARPKTFRAVTDARSNTIDMSVSHMPEDMTRVQAETHMEGLVMGLFTGDWYDAAGLYRDWALEQFWARKGPVKERQDIPEWLKDTVLWWCLSSGKDTGTLSTEREVAVEEVGDVALALHKRFPYPTGVHWYNWHCIPFNTSFPDYLPAKEGFAEQVGRLDAAGVKVMPYINARLADPNSQTWQQDDAARFCARKASPRCEPYHYPMLYEQYANQQYLVPMCSATEYWQDKVASTVEAMREQLGIGAVYLDQVACGAPPVCFAPDHGHALGGGDYGIRGYEAMLEKIHKLNASGGDRLALTTESNAEPFMAGIPAYLMWMPCPDYQVPLFAAVYSGYVITFGRAFYDADLQQPEAFAAKIAQMLVWGCQLGWIRNSVAEKLLSAEHTSDAEFLDSVCRAFASGREYLIEGHMCRPPVALTPMEVLTTNWYYRPGQAHTVQLPCLMATLWRSLAGSQAFAVANLSEKTREVTYRVEVPDSVQITGKDLTGAGVAVEVRSRKGSWADVMLTVPGRSAAMVELGRP